MSTTDLIFQTFNYISPLWGNKVAYNEQAGQTGLDHQETKLPAYWNTPFSTICLGMNYGGQTRFLKIHRSASSLYSLIADGVYRPTNLARNAWKGIISGGSLQPNCNKEGFNAWGNTSGNLKMSSARIGITSNQENECNSNDSRIGFGTAGYPDDSISCGNVALANHGANNGDRHSRAMCYILVQ